MAPTRAHRGDAHRSPVIETSSTRALFTVFYNHRMLTRSRRVIAHTRTQRAPIPPPLVRAPHFRRRPLPLERRLVAAPSSARLRSSLHSSRPIEPIAFAFAFAFASCRRESARRSSFIEDARPSKRTRRRDDDDAAVEMVEPRRGQGSKDAHGERAHGQASARGRTRGVVEVRFGRAKDGGGHAGGE